MYRAKIRRVAFNPRPNQIAIAGISAIKGPMNGINSIIQAINANVNISSIFIQKKRRLSSQRKVIIKILQTKINWLLIHENNVSTMITSFFNRYVLVVGESKLKNKSLIECLSSQINKVNVNIKIIFSTVFVTEDNNQTEPHARLDKFWTRELQIVVILALIDVNRTEISILTRYDSIKEGRPNHCIHFVW